jgi:ribosome maturation factor RimP
MPPATAGQTTAQARQHLIDVLSPVVSAAGYDLEDVTVTSAGRRSLVRVSVDRDGGIDLDAVAEVSHIVADFLEDDGPGGGAFAGPYVLEVSSPGVDRPLTEPRHWRRAVGRLVQTELAGTAITGRIESADYTGVEFDVAGTRRRASYAELGRGRVQVEFNRATPEDDDADGEEA